MNATHTTPGAPCPGKSLSVSLLYSQLKTYLMIRIRYARIRKDTAGLCHYRRQLRHLAGQLPEGGSRFRSDEEEQAWAELMRHHLATRYARELELVEELLEHCSNLMLLPDDRFVEAVDRAEQAVAAAHAE